MTRLAIQEALLPGRGVADRLARAKDLGIDAVEFACEGLDARLPEVAAALGAHDISACGINMGRAGGCLSADRETRRRAADALREAMTCALDLEADYVTFVPQCGESDLPDLTPFAAPMDLQKELLLWLLRGATDLAEAMECRLALLPLNHYETGFITRLEQAAWFRRQVDDHQAITLAASLYHMALAEGDLLGSLRAQAGHISVLYLSDNNGGWPGQGLLPFPAIGEVLRETHYGGWLVLERPGPLAQAADALPRCLDFLRAAGIS